MAKASSCCRHRNRWLCLPAIDALPNRNAISKAPRAAGYRGSDFVLWHTAPLRRAALLVRKLEANGRQLVRGRTTRLTPNRRHDGLLVKLGYSPSGLASGQRRRSSNSHPWATLFMPGNRLAASVISITASRYQSNRPRIDQMPHLSSCSSASSNRQDRQVKSQTADI